MTKKTSLIAGLVLILSAPLGAHHSFAMYDMTQTKSATGKLIRFVPGANHAQLHFEVLDAAGKTVMKGSKPSVMGVETGSAAQLARQGVTVDEFPIGTIITVAYIDPDNYQTDVSSGAQFEYKLLFMMLVSNIIAIYLQVSHTVSGNQPHI